MKVRIEKIATNPGENDDESSIGEIFFENTKLNSLNSREYGTYIEILGSAEYFLSKMSCPYKMNPLLETIDLEAVEPADEKDEPLAVLKDILLKRRSRREFSGEAISLQQISDMIFYSSGINAEAKHHKTDQVMARFRAYPSGGGLYPIEIYLAALNVEGLKPGTYHYNVRKNKLEIMKIYNRDYLKKRVFEMCVKDPLVRNSSVVIFISCFFRRTNFKYNERGFRFAFIEAGHCCQNMYLLAEAMNLGLVSLGGFYDDEINRFLNLDGVNEAVVYPVVIGRRSAQVGTLSGEK